MALWALYFSPRRVDTRSTCFKDCFGYNFLNTDNESIKAISDNLSISPHFRRIETKIGKSNRLPLCAIKQTFLNFVSQLMNLSIADLTGTDSTTSPFTVISPSTMAIPVTLVASLPIGIVGVTYV